MPSRTTLGQGSRRRREEEEEEEGGRRVVLLVLVVLPVAAAAAGRAQPQLVVHLLTIENYAYYELRGSSTGRGRGRWVVGRGGGRVLPSFCY